jgi:hypothetical protein
MTQLVSTAPDFTGVPMGLRPQLNPVTASSAASAAKWTTARTLSFTGDATGSGSVDGSANVATALTLAASGASAATYGDATHVAQVAVDAKGRVTAASNVAITAGSPAAVAFASLPGSPVDGQRAFITNCSVTAFHGVADGAGTNHVPVYWDGGASNWKIG